MSAPFRTCLAIGPVKSVPTEKNGIIAAKPMRYAAMPRQPQRPYRPSGLKISAIA